MKITRRKLRQIIKEELSTLSKIGKSIDDLTTVDSSLSREDAEYAYDNLGVRLADEKGKVLGKEGTVERLMTDPDGLDDLEKQIKQLLTKGHLKVNDIKKSLAKAIGMGEDPK